MTFDGYGPAILPATAVSSHLRGQFELLTLEGFPRRRVGVALRRRGMPSAPTRALLDVMRTAVGDPGNLPEGLHASLQPAEA